MKSEIYLRALELSDLDRTHRWHNDAFLYAHLGGAFRFVSRAAEEQWLKQRCEYNRGEVNVAICLKDSDEHIGNIYLRHIDWISRTAELNLFIASPDARSKGCGTDAVASIAEHAFNVLGLRRLYLYVLADNDAAIALYEKCGFSREGILRQHVLKMGEYKDMLVMGLLRTSHADQ